MIIHLSRNVSEHRRVAKQRLLRLTNNIWVLGGSDGKESACNARDPVLIPGLERSPGKRMATQSGILAWKFHVVPINSCKVLNSSSLWGRKESDITEQLTTEYVESSDHHV